MLQKLDIFKFDLPEKRLKNQVIYFELIVASKNLNPRIAEMTLNDLNYLIPKTELL